MKTYTVEQVIAAGCNLEPIKCRFCGETEVVYLQYVGDGVCQMCGKWQLKQAKRRKA